MKTENSFKTFNTNSANYSFRLILLKNSIDIFTGGYQWKIYCRLMNKAESWPGFSLKLQSTNWWKMSWSWRWRCSAPELNFCILPSFLPVSGTTSDPTKGSEIRRESSESGSWKSAFRNTSDQAWARKVWRSTWEGRTSSVAQHPRAPGDGTFGFN